MEFELGDDVEITAGQYKGLVGEITDNDTQADTDEFGTVIQSNIYQITGESIDLEDAESWVPWYSLKKIVV